MAGILTTPPSTSEALSIARPAPPAPSVGAQPNTLSMNNPLAGTAVPGPSGAPPVHSNQAINEALMSAFRPVVPDQINSLLGPAIGQLQGHTPPIAFYQPRPAAQVATRRSS